MPDRKESAVLGGGAAGCVEIIGNFDDFKSDIAEATGKTTDSDAAIQSLVSEGKLYVEVKSAIRPNLKNELWKEIPFR